MSDETRYDLIVIGSGPGGYVGAIRAAQLGMRVVCVEKDAALGGTCLNVGCIPSKALLESSEHYAAARHDLAAHGVLVDGVRLDLAAMMTRKAGIVGQLTQGVGFLFKKNKVDRVHGFGRISGPHTVEIADESGAVRTLTGERILVATGSVSSSLPGVEPDGEHVVTSTEALAFDAVPEHLVVIGAGVIGLEVGSVWARLGAKVTFLEYLPNILGATDAEIARHSLRVFKKQGLEFQLGVAVQRTVLTGDRVEVFFKDKKGDEHSVTADKVLLAVGRKPFTTGLGLDEVGVALDPRGRVVVDEHYRTSLESIYAIGDVIPGPMLAHKAEDEAVACVERMAGIAAHINYDAIPAVVYTWPEVASVGRTEEQLAAADVPFRKGTFPFVANGRAKAIGTTDGLVKMLAHAETDAILGCHILGPRAGDLIAEIAVAMEFGASSEDIVRSSHAHPSLAEAVREAALAVDGRTLNL